MSNGKRFGILLNSTAPAMTLMSGAMLAFAEQDVEFDTITTTGAGGLIGMLYLAPKGKNRVEALKELPNLFVSDWLYRFFPVNFKVFHKYGPFAEQIWELRKRLPQLHVAPEDPSEIKRFINDWTQLWATILTPRSYQTLNKGLMSHVPLIEDLVHFDKLKAQASQGKGTKFYINTFSLRKRRLRVFDEQQPMSSDIFNAAQAMYMLFEPVRVANDLLITGATRDPTGLQAIGMHRRGLTDRPPLDGLLALDPVSEAFWRTPENAYDAFQLMLMNPIAALQELMLTFYGWTEWHVNGGAPTGGGLTPLYRIPVADEISEDYYPRMLDWTHANAMKLQKIGHDAALPIARLLKDGGQPPPAEGGLPPMSGASNGHLEAHRYKGVVTPDSGQVPGPRATAAANRAQQFVSLYKPMMDNITKFISPSTPDAQPKQRRAAQ
jgi:NTE family protein